MKKRNVKIAVTATALATCLAIGGISAYFTDADTKTNTFTVGKVAIELEEPTWEPPTDIVPEQEFAKDPQIANNGKNDAFVFMEVVVPYATVVTADENGNKQAAAKTELFSWDVNEGWYLMEDENETLADKTEESGTVTYLYAYGDASAMTTLEDGHTTPTLFDVIKFANLVEDQTLEDTQNVVVNSYAIQTTHITDSEDYNGEDDGTVTPADVWAVLSTQAPEM